MHKLMCRLFVGRFWLKAIGKNTWVAYGMKVKDNELKPCLCAIRYLGDNKYLCQLSYADTAAQTYLATPFYRGDDHEVET